MNLPEQLVHTNQGRLMVLGYYHGKQDGQDGSLTQNAFTAFKRHNGFTPRPFPGPLTLTKLWSSSAIPAPKPDPVEGEPAHLTRARSFYGLKEVRGSGNNPEIMAMAERLDQWYPADDLPWCGLFVADTMASTYPNEPQDFNRLGARAWEAYGKKLSSRSPVHGAVCRLWRTHRTNSWHGHVGFITGISADGKWIRMLGGNQSDAVNEKWFPQSRVLGYNVPEGFDGGPVPIAKVGVLSVTEA